MKFIGPQFYISKNQRNALLILVSLLFFVIFFRIFFVTIKPQVLNEKEMNHYQKFIDSLAKLKITPTKIYPFNPNHLSEYRAYFLGLEPESIDRLKAYREAGNWLNTANQFQSIAKINDSLMSVLLPYLIFDQRKKTRDIPKVIREKKGINLCQADDLKLVYGVGEKLSQRIINYRNFLQGYSEMDQLYEVYGLDSLVVEKIKMQFEIKVAPQIKKVTLNTVSYRDLEGLPYVSPSDAQRIIRWRTTNEGIDFEDLQNIEGFDSLKIKRISLYLHRF